MPITGDWQPIRDGIEVRFNKFAWENGYTVAFANRCQLVTAVEKIEKNTITLRDAPSAPPCAILRHCDDAALQAAINARSESATCTCPSAVMFIPGLRVRNAASITIEGASAVDTLLDISEGEGACVPMTGGTEVTLRNFPMVGPLGLRRIATSAGSYTRAARATSGGSRPRTAMPRPSATPSGC